MNNGIPFVDACKHDAVVQVVERASAVSKLSERLKISTKSLCTWKAQFSKLPQVRTEGGEQVAMIKRLKRVLVWVSGERKILKQATA